MACAIVVIMKNSLRIASAAIAAISLGFTAPLSASALPGDWIANDAVVGFPQESDGSYIRWFIDSYSGTMGHVMRFIPSGAYDPMYTDYDGNEIFHRTAHDQDFSINGLTFVNNNDFDSAEDENGDRVITGSGQWAGLDDEVEIRVYAEQNLMRTTHLLTNNTVSAIEVEFEVDHSVTDETADGLTSDGDVTFEITDEWFSCWDVTVPSMVYSFFWGASLLGTQDLDLVDDDEGDPLTDIVVPWSGPQTFETFTIEPGGQYQLVLFNSNREYDTGGNDADNTVAAKAAANAAAAEFENGLSGRAARGLSSDIAGNWTLAAADGEETLATTGSDSSGAGVSIGIAASLLVAAVAVRRGLRRRHAQQ